MAIDYAIYHKPDIHESSACHPTITISDSSTLIGDYEPVHIGLYPINSSPIMEINDLIIHSLNLEGNELMTTEMVRTGMSVIMEHQLLTDVTNRLKFLTVISD